MREALAEAWHAALPRIVQGLLLSIGAAFAGLLLTYVLLRPTVPDDADLWTINRTPAMKFLDAGGGIIGARGGLYTEPLRLAEIPDHLRLAFLITEDKRFYDHGAVDWWGVGRALFANTMEGDVVQGGSTITQQLAKNIFLTSERTLSRKVKEVILARDLEAKLTKAEILELYLNRIYLGGGAYGVEAAAQTFFGTSARDVTLAEAAMLAGLAKAPSRYAPTTSLERAQARARIVLELLRREQVIDNQAFAEALLNPATLSNRAFSGDVNYFLDYATAEVLKLVDNPDVDLIITTTLDQDLQRKAEAAVREVMDALPEERSAEQAALVSLATDGAVKAMVGGRSYQKSQFNRAAQAYRQPGSAFKPLVYLTALENGIRPSTVYYDNPTRIGDWTPANYGNVYRGRVTVTDAVMFSLNTVAAQVARDVGHRNIADTARRLGIESPLADDATIALGTSEVTLIELTNAYAAFANTGLAAPRYAVTRIETEDGELVYERVPPEEPVRLFAEDVAENMTYMLYQVVNAGTGRGAHLGPRPAAGKTGTTQDWKDAWFIGYTGQYVTGVWVGNDDSTPMERVTGGEVSADIWKAYMTAAHDGLDVVALPGALGARPDIAVGERRQFFISLKSQFRQLQDNPRARSKSEKKKKRRGFWIFGN